LVLERDRATVEEHDSYIVVRTPANPGYYFGNFLIFDCAPQPGDFDRWRAAFERAFARDADVRHAAFAWSIDASPAAIDEFTVSGYAFEETAVLIAHDVAPCEEPAGMHVRPLRDDADWSAQLALGLANREAEHEPQSYAAFKARQVMHHRHLAGTSGAWLGAFDGERLAGSCGIFRAGDSVARYQDVGVLAEYRNRGIARCLISHAARYAREQLGAHRLVIAADAHDFPRKLYERAGFRLQEREGALWIARR
jgi:RimJ/RimL family protein N-acetyltransferase